MLELKRFYTKNNWDMKDVLRSVKWHTVQSTIHGKDNEIIFDKTVKFPVDWSETAVNITASKYFYCGKDREEYSLAQLIERVVNKLTEWMRKKYIKITDTDIIIFRAELTYIILHQIASFNSPVWFNLGLDDRKNQCSACFLVGVDDDMESIKQLGNIEFDIFNSGSGSGSNYSNLRGSMEEINGGGTSSGPIPFMRVLDSQASTIKSAGKLRRAAKMVILDIDHPDIEEFIESKSKEEDKAIALIKAGYSSDIDGEAYRTVHFQNQNNSIRVTNDFMILSDFDGQGHENVHALNYRGPHTTTYKYKTMNASKLMDKIAKASWRSGDPGLHFKDTINKWNTLKNSGEIRISNPCSEVFNLDDTACNLASINVAKLLEKDSTHEALHHIVQIMVIAQDVMIDYADYPHERLAKGAKNTRNLGLGITNLGSLLMRLGLAYDSDLGRKFAVSIMGTITSYAYTVSGLIGKTSSAFPLYAANRKPMADVMHMHKVSILKYVKPIDTTLDLHRHIDSIATTNIEQSAKRFDMLDGLIRNNEVQMANSYTSCCAPCGCLAGDSLILTDKGLCKIKDIGDKDGQQWQDIKLSVATDDGPQQATKFYINGQDKTLTIDTEHGYSISGTLKHKIKIVGKNKEWCWKQFQDIDINDQIPIYIGGLIGNSSLIKLKIIDYKRHGNCNDVTMPKYMTKDLAQFIGYFMADGSLHNRSIRLCVTDSDTDIMDKLCKLSYSLFNINAKRVQRIGNVSIELHSKELVAWWKENDFNKHGHDVFVLVCHIPKTILNTNSSSIYGAFLNGLFSADGTVSSGVPNLSNKYMPFIRDIMTMNATLGFPCRLSINIGGYSKRKVYRIKLSNNTFCEKWANNIGFMGKRKQSAIINGNKKAQNDLIPISKQHIYGILSNHVDCDCYKSACTSFGRYNCISRLLAQRIYNLTEDKTLECLLQYFYTKTTKISVSDIQDTYDISVPSNVTYIANGMVSHNTISFMMDAKTTGIEPELALTKYKKTVGGNTMCIVSDSIKQALKVLGYTDPETEKYIVENNTALGAPHIEKEHLPVFECALGKNKQDTISAQAHIDMVAALQIATSMGISKTINIPENSTVEDIKNIYIEAWKRGLKCVTIYRDNSKATQPLNVSLPESKDTIIRGNRVCLPDERQSITHKFTIGNQDGYITVGLYPDGKPGEIFIIMAQVGTFTAGVIDKLATACSLGLQYGVPLEHFVQKFKGSKFEPRGITPNPGIPFAASVIDYVGRWLEQRFLMKKGEVSNNQLPTDIDLESTELTGNLCSSCGERLIRAGTCEYCTNCFASAGCS